MDLKTAQELQPESGQVGLGWADPKSHTNITSSVLQRERKDWKSRLCGFHAGAKVFDLVKTIVLGRSHKARREKKDERAAERKMTALHTEMGGCNKLKPGRSGL